MLDTVQAPAKVNLHLSILGRRPDGYHDLESLFMPVPGLADSLEIGPGEAGAGCLVEPELPGTPMERNLVYLAWKAYGQRTCFAPDLQVRLTKRIPTGAGLGGGSSDAAAMLRWLQARAGERALPEPALTTLAARIGADVPFFLHDGPAWAHGIGDELIPAPLDLSGCTLLLVLPAVHVSSAWAYAAWDESEAKASQRCLTTAAPTHKRRVSLSPVMVHNDFEAVVFPAHPELRVIKERLLGMGAAAAVMSGSGAGLAGVFRDGRLARKSADEFLSSGLSVHLEALRKWGVAKW